MGITQKGRKRRRSKLGSSDAPAIVGVSPWRTRTDVYWSKIGPDEDDSPTSAMATGNRLESALLDFAVEELGVPVLRNAYRVSAAHNVLAANLDALITSTGRAAIEAKYVGQSNSADWGQPGTDEVPEHVIVQVQHQMAVADLDCVWVAAAVAGWQLDWRLYRVDRHEGLIRIIVEAELEFWARHVVPEVPPTDGPPPMEILRAMRREPNSVIYLDDEGAAALDIYQRLTEQRKASDHDVEEAKRNLLAMLGEHEAARLPDGLQITYLEQRSPARCDNKKLRREYPAAYDACVSQGSHRVLRIKKPQEAICDERKQAVDDDQLRPARLGADNPGGDVQV